MPADRRFRFAIQAFNAPSAAAWRETARRAEALGYSALHLADHFLGPARRIAGTNHPIQKLAAVPAMAVAAEALSVACSEPRKLSTRPLLGGSRDGLTCTMSTSWSGPSPTLGAR